MFLLLVVIVGLVFFLRTDTFNIEDISVTGNTMVSSQEIVARSGIKKSKNIFSFNASKSQKNIEEIAMVKKAHIIRRYPSSVEIKIEERTAWYVLDSEKTYFDIDKDGKVLSKSSSLMRYDCPYVNGINVKNKVKVGENLYDRDNAKLRTIKEVFDMLNENDLKAEVSQLHVSKKGRYYIYLKKGNIIEFHNYSGFKAHSSFIKYFISNEDRKVKVELIDGINPIYSKIK